MSSTLPAIVNTTTGELVSLADATDDQLALAARETPEQLVDALRLIDEQRRTLDAFRADLSTYLIRRMDADATQTLHTDAGTITINGSTDEVEEFNADVLLSALEGLVSEGVLSEAAVEKAIRTKREASKSGINSLRALHKPEVDAALEHAVSTRWRPRRVTVK